MLVEKYKKMFSKTEEEEQAEEVEPLITQIAPDTVFNGSITGQDTVRISGLVTGDIDCKMVWVDGRGRVNGKIAASRVIIEGELNGDIQTADRVEIRSNGKMVGNIYAATIAVAQGCLFEGESHIIRQ